MNFFGIDITNEYNKWTLIFIALYVILVAVFFRKSTGILGTIPGFCAGIGVFFTFLVLYDNLKDFSTPERDKEFLEDLVRELSAAFSTSIIGVFFSFLTNPFVKWRIDWLERRGYKGKDYIRKHPHELLHEIRLSNESIRDEVIKLKGTENPATLESLSASVNNLTANTIAKLERLFDSLEKQFEKTIDALSADAIEDAKKTIVSVNDKFTDQVSSLLKQNMDDIATFFSQHKKFLEQTSSDYSREGEELKQRMDDIKNDFDNKINSVRDAFAKSAEDMHLKYHEEGQNLSKRFDEVKSSFTKDSEVLSNKMEDSKKDFADKIEIIRQTFADSVSKMAENYQEEGANLGKIFNDVKSSLIGLDENIQTATQTILENNLNKLNAAFEKIHELQLTAQNNLSQTTSEFADAVERYQLMSNDQQMILESIKRQMQEIEELKESAGQLLTGWKSMSDEVKRLEHRVADIANTITQLESIHSYLNGNTLKSIV